MRCYGVSQTPRINQWYEEKADWVGNTGKVTGHYTQMIDPDNTYIGLATFVNPAAQYSTTTSGEFRSFDTLDESVGPAIDNCVQTVEVETAKVTASISGVAKSLKAGSSTQAKFVISGFDNGEFEPLGEVKWTSSAPKTATVDQNGNITAVHEGTAKITVKNENLTATSSVQVTGHPNTKLQNAKEASCREEGYTGDLICTDCGETIESGKTIPKSEHSWDAGQITKKPTCEEPGEKTYICSKCNETKTEAIKATGHKVVTDPAVEATCEKDGKTEGSHCSVCNKVLVEQKTIKATGHKVVADPAVEATCEKDGKTEGSHCSVCNKVLTEPTTIPAIGHKYGDWKTTSVANVFAPEKQTRTCEVCGKSEEQTVGSKLPRTMKVSMTSMPLQIKQKTTVLKVTNLAKGDSVASWKSSNSKIVTVKGKASGSSTVTAGKKTGKAKITITLKSGLKRSVSVSVQKSPVKATKITGISKTLKLRKGKKTTLRPQLAPLTCIEKVTYKSSNTKIAAVSSKGIVTAKKKGTAVITVKAGKKAVKCKIVVK
ncbi:MAG: Ig-like domain-containing protein [Lachnospiraceae bacterium]|nr:Ig-like domain-containing protein [Lachnospiraceae bacterium]